MCSNQSGNALIIVLVTVALFGALIFTFTRSGEQGTGNLSSNQNRLAAQEILQYASAVEGAVNRLRTRSVSENTIDFRNGVVSPTYENANCSESACRVFDNAGGKAIWQSPPALINSGEEWVISGAVRVSKIGTDEEDPASADLTLLLPNITREACVFINSFIEVSNPGNEPPIVADAVSYATPFTGTFATGDLITHAALDGKSTGCFQNGSAYHFYHVLLAR